MDIQESLALGALQGLTEYLPVSSSGHLEVASAFMEINDPDRNLTFVVLVHAATALSSIIVFWKQVVSLLSGLFQFKWNKETRYISMLVISAIPVIALGLLFEDEIKKAFGGNIVLVGAMWLVTALLLLVTITAKKNHKEVNFFRAIVIGIAQAIAVLPGISRSGATIATALMLEVDREKAARFSFLMVIIPILGKAALDVKDLLTGEGNAAAANQDMMPLLVGFLTAFVTGLVACMLMLRIVKKGKLHYFAIYCLVMGVVAILKGSGAF